MTYNEVYELSVGTLFRSCRKAINDNGFRKDGVTCSSHVSGTIFAFPVTFTFGLALSIAGGVIREAVRISSFGTDE